MSNQTPIQAFFNQTEHGESHWWSWLAVFWFAIAIWFYGQLIVSIPMFIAGSIVDPDGLQAMMASASTEQGNTGLDTIALLASLGLPLVAILLFLLRNQFKPENRTLVMSIAGGIAALSFAAIIYMMITGSDPQQMEVLNSWMEKSPIVYLCMLLSFPPLAIGVWLGQRFIHRRTILSLHTAAKRFRWRRMVFAMLVFWAIAAASSFIADRMGVSTMEFVFDPSKFWVYLPITLLFIPLQSATEEIMLRGYLNQGLARYIKNPWIVFFITSAGFAALHLGNPEVAETTKESSVIIAMSGYFFFGLFACILTYIDGGLETAIGMHAANNMFAAAIVGYESSALPTPTVFRVPLNSSLDGIMVLVMMSLLCIIMFMTRKPLEIGDPRIDKTLDTFE